jgi:hypothetical protein
MLSNPSNKSGPVARAATFGLPWFVVIAFSATVAWALNTALTGIVPTPAEATQPLPALVARSAAGEAYVHRASVAYIGQGNWIPDLREPCRTEAAPADSSCETISVGQQYLGLNTWVPSDPISSCSP